MSIKAECTWGDGPDVLLSVDDRNKGRMYPLMLLEPVEGFNYGRHGISKWASMGMSSQEARKLAAELIDAATQAEQLDKMLDDSFEKEQANANQSEKD